MDETSPQLELLDSAECAAEIARIRDRGLLGKAGRLSDLFDYLLQRSLEDDPPKEIEIIDAVFSSGARVAPEDSVARVYVHRLRKRLEEISPGANGDIPIRLRIPRGEYRLVAERIATRPMIGKRSSQISGLIASSANAIRQHAIVAGVSTALALLLVGNIVAWSRLTDQTRSAAAASITESAIWSPLAKSKDPLLIVVGDYYMFGEYKDRLFLTRLIRDFSINSKDDLIERYLSSPATSDRYGDVALQYLPTSVAFALADLSPVLANKQVQVTLASELTDRQIKENDIVYVGLLSGLGKLKGPVFTSSRFAIGESYDTLLDTKGGASYTSEAFLAAPSDSMYRDYGLFKSFAGPTGKHIVVLAGARDTALMGLSETLTRNDSIADLEAFTGAANGMETLFEVQGRKHVNLEARLLVSAPVDSAAIWSSAPDDLPVFPNQ